MKKCVKKLLVVGTALFAGVNSYAMEDKVILVIKGEEFHKFAQISNKDAEQNIKKCDNIEEMVKWWQDYDPSKNSDTRKDQLSQSLVAEATYWSVQLGLDKLIIKMTEEELKNFRPLEESFSGKTLRSKLLEAVSDKLTIPSMSFHASFALGQAAWSIFMHHKQMNSKL